MANNEGIHFPIYRKYKNNKRFYKIINKKEFEEIQVIGSKTLVNHIKASQLPEFNFINDLMSYYDGFAEEIDEAEYERVK